MGTDGQMSASARWVTSHNEDHEDMSVVQVERGVRPPRRRDAARATWRQARAVELALQGYSYDAIASEIGVSNRGNAWRTVQKALHDRVVTGVDELRAVELDRLDVLQVAAWDRAATGDLAAVLVVLRVMDRRARLLGLYAPHDTNPAPVKTVVQLPLRQPGRQP
jgi:hypothetical protein